MPRTQILFLLVIGILGLVTSSARMWLSWQTRSWLEVAGYSLGLGVAIWALVAAILGMRARLRAAAPPAGLERAP